MYGVGMYFERRRSGMLCQKWVNLFMVSCAESLFAFNFFFSFFNLFSPFCFGCVLFSKIKSFDLGLSFDFFVFYFFFVVKVESGLQKINLLSFELLLIWSG